MPQPILRRRAQVRTVILAAAAVVAVCIAAMSPASASTPTGGGPTPGAAANLAADNLGKSAGGCSQEPVATRTNSLGGTHFRNSCLNGGEYWCSDFLGWVWDKSGYDINYVQNGVTKTISAYVGTVIEWGNYQGTVHTSSSYVAHEGDAIVYRYKTSSGAWGDYAHVGIVTSVGSDGTVHTANGDFGGVSGQGMVEFAETSLVKGMALYPNSTGTHYGYYRNVGSYNNQAGGGAYIYAYVSP